MSFDPEYGETLVAEDDLESLTEQARAVVGDPVRKADVYDLEQAIWAQVAADRLTAVLNESLTVEEILTDHFVRQLHIDLYARIWTWAGRHRRLETNVGVAPEQIALRLRTDVDDLRWRWLHTTDLTPRVLGIAFHAIVVHIHPFIDGNGRTTRLLADLAFAATQESDELLEYDWDVDRPEYIRLLRHFDLTRDTRPLAGLVGVRPVGD